MAKSDLRRLPSVGQMAERDDVQALALSFSRTQVITALRKSLDTLRAELLQDESTTLPSPEEIVCGVERDLTRSARPGVQKAINATGVILHTGLGRAILSPAARQALYELDGYCLVQMDVETGERCLREAHVEKLLAELTGSEAATVVNNNAGATLLVLNTIAKGQQVIVSRGQLVEIGGSFRIPDVMEQSGARLVEVGTTNRTHLRDYENAINENTAALLHVHTSNYRIQGFTKSVSVAELAELGRRYSLPVVDDLGSGALIDLARFGFGTEPLVSESVKCGADLITFSADKLVGGPQGGIILGSRDQIQRVRKNSLMRALRVDKLILLALEMTLREFLDPEKLMANHPTMRLFGLPLDGLRQRAHRLAQAIAESVPNVEVAVERGASRIGSGSLPLEEVPTYTVMVGSSEHDVGRLSLALRRAAPPIITRIHEERLVFDLRTILNDHEEQSIVESLAKIMEKNEA